MTHGATALAQTAPELDLVPTDPMSVRMQLEATSQAVLAADEAYLRKALGRMSPRRRGLLRILTRT
jgi:hypothetical protein